MKISQLIIAILLLVLISCDSSINGIENENELPNTFLVVDTIIRIGEDRLDSQVDLKWWSDDVDGFVKTYEFTFDENLNTANWISTEKEDSTFVLSTPTGLDTVDFKFSVRAIDNLNGKDLTPASIFIPVKNTAPSVQFINQANLPTSSFPVFKVFWQAEDQDGIENIDYLEIGLNDSINVMQISKTTTAATFTLSENGNDALVYLNNSINAEQETLNGFLMNDTNRVYIRAIDKSAAKSNFASSKTVFIKDKTSDILFIDAYFFNGAPVLDFYDNYLDSIGINDFDVINLFETDDAGFKTQQSVDNLTQSRVFNLFDIIIWVGNEPEENLALAQRTTFDFFNNGGKMLMSLKIGSTFDEQLDVSDFTPIESFVVASDTALILENAMLVNQTDSNYPTLKATAFISPVKPFSINVGSEVLYNADLTARKISTNTLSEWNGTSTIIAAKKDNAGNTNFVFSCVELHKLNGNNNFNNLMEQILINEFGQ